MQKDIPTFERLACLKAAKTPSAEGFHPLLLFGSIHRCGFSVGVGRDLLAVCVAACLTECREIL
jgi:hypothetical protein